MALVEGASSQDLLDKTIKAYPDDEALQCCLEMAPFTGVEGYRVGLSAVLAKRQIRRIRRYRDNAIAIAKGSYNPTIQAAFRDTEEARRAIREIQETNRTAHRVPKQDGKTDLTLFIFSSKIRVWFCYGQIFK